ncbi:MAG: helix-turn-helix domain-containing protein, partial [Hyphomicrobiaceae bacterium]
MERRALRRHRINRAMNFMQAHLAEPLGLDMLSEVACLSKYHFTRVFRAQCGETPLEYLWRLRFERAARSLVYLSEKPVTDIAMEHGFSSSQTFSSTFRRRYRSSPMEFRSANQIFFDRMVVGAVTDLAAQRPVVVEPAFDLARPSVTIGVRPTYRIAYLRHIGPYHGPLCRVSDTYKMLERWARSRGLSHETQPAIGVCPDHSAFTP